MDAKNKICVADFDGTLLSGEDSMLSILVGERLIFRPKIFAWSLALACVVAMPKTKQRFIRRKLKFHMFRAIASKGEAEILRKYAGIFARHLNARLILFLTEHYDQVFVVSSSWRRLLEETLKGSAIEGAVILGTEPAENFSDFDVLWHTGKLKAIKEKGIENFDLFTDSYDDLPLMRSAEKVFLISKDCSWKKLD